jgi:hypothetical protein
LDQTRSYADGVLFEFSRHRAAALEFREQVRRLQPQLRSLFVVRISVLEYRLHVPGFEAPEAALRAQAAFDDCSARILEGLANEIETGGARPEAPGACLTAGVEMFDPSYFALLSDVDNVTGSLVAQIDSNIIGLAARLE